MSKRSRTIEDEDPLLRPETRSSKKPRSTVKRGKGKKRPPTLKSQLLKKLRARKKKLNSELKTVNRDINSLVCKRKKNETG